MIFAPVIFAIGLLSTSAAKSATDFTPVAGIAPARLHFDAPLGYYDKWRHKVVCPINAIRTAVRFDDLRPTTGYWRPNFSIFLISGPLQVGVRVASAPSARPPFAATMQKGKTRGSDPEVWVRNPDEHLLAKQFTVHQSIPIAIDWTADGRVTVTVGGHSFAYDLGAPVEEMQFSAAHSEGEFDPLLVGFTGTEKSARAACRVIASVVG